MSDDVQVVHVRFTVWEGAKLGAGIFLGPFLVLLLPFVAVVQLVMRWSRRRATEQVGRPPAGATPS